MNPVAICICTKRDFNGCFYLKSRQASSCYSFLILLLLIRGSLGEFIVLYLVNNLFLIEKYTLPVCREAELYPEALLSVLKEHGHVFV